MRLKQDVLPIIRILLLLLLTLLAGVFQNVFLLSLPIPLLLLVPLTVSFSMKETETASLLLGALAGGIYDLASPVHDGVFALLFASFALAVSLASRYKLRDTLMSAALLAFLFAEGVGMAILIFTAVRLRSFPRDYVTGMLFPMALLAALLTPLCYYPVCGIEKKFR